MKHLLPHVVDAIFAAVSVVSGIALLYFLSSQVLSSSVEIRHLHHRIHSSFALHVLLWLVSFYVYQWLGLRSQVRQQ